MVLAFVVGASRSYRCCIGLSSLFQPAPPLFVAGLFFCLLGVNTSQAFPWMLGATLVVVSVALFARALGSVRAPPSPAWACSSSSTGCSARGDRCPSRRTLDGGFEMFFLSGVTMVSAATFVLVYNAD